MRNFLCWNLLQELSMVSQQGMPGIDKKLAVNAGTTLA